MEAVSEVVHRIDTDEVISRLESSTGGLSSEQVSKRLAKYGPNKIPEPQQTGIFTILLSQFNSPIVYLLILASGASILFRDYTEAIAIFLVIIVNAVIGFIMEFQARKSMAALKELDKSFTKVYRNGSLVEVSSETLVPGDMIYLEAGDIIPADARLIQVNNIEVDESPLTGESFPVSKSTDVLQEDTITADKINVLFKGTSVTRGNAKAILYNTGSKTELGKIAGMLDSSSDELPLDKKLQSFSKKMIYLVIAISLPFLGIGLWQQREVYLMIETAIALAVAAIPEGLPIVATIALARGMLRLAKQQVIIKKLAAVETLGSANIILTDKTGTLTENKLKVQNVILPNGTELETQWSEDDSKITLHTNETDLIALNRLKEVAIICNNAVYEEGKNEVGDPLEIALLKFSIHHDSSLHSNILSTTRRINEVPFDSKTKIMGVLTQREKGFFTASKGSVSEILDKCKFKEAENDLATLSASEKQTLLDLEKKFAAEGMKILGYAFKDSEHKDDAFMEDMVFAGMTAFLDPPRQDVKLAMEQCRKAGIKVVMVTGDHYETARSIALKVGLIDEKKEITGLEGKQLAEMNLADSASQKNIEDCDFFSRTTPEQKFQLVKFYQEKGYVVGMTGDGINDAPALKKAEIGIAMGMRGTQVAREAADMVLKDDSFGSLVVAIKQGRTIYNNVKNFIIYLLSCNLSEIMIVAIAAFSNMVLPLLPLQILFLNLVTDVFPALALGMGKESRRVMESKPRSINEPLITRGNWISIVVYASVVTSTVLAIFVYCRIFENYSPAHSNTIVFFSLSFAQLLHPLSLISSETSFFSNTITKNIHVWLAVGFCIFLLLMVYFWPMSKEVLALHEISPKDLMYIVLAGVIPVVIIRITKKLGLIT
ncbi:MAG: cation-transporting P-type ATPase [Chitinophagales bacterium]|nr:cation-transporting P-type ATPase [Chitinophagales bacterium]